MPHGRRFALALALATAAVFTPTNGQLMVAKGFESGVNVVLNVPNAAKTCLSVMQDGKNLELTESCSTTNPTQVWYYFSDQSLGTKELFMKEFSDNAGAVQVYGSAYVAKSATEGSFMFLNGGKIMNVKNQKCLAVGFFLNQSPPVQLLKFDNCNAAPSWRLVGASLPFNGSPKMPVIESTPQITPQSNPQISQQSTPIAAQPHIESPQTPEVIIKSAGGDPPQTSTIPSVERTSPKDAVIAKGNSGMPTQADHYLCICLISKDDDKCIDAVKAACVVGHIPSDLCHESFEEGNHDRISKHIISIIQRGAACPSADIEKLRTEVAESSLPTHRFHGEQVVTSEDHYLCICLSTTGESKYLDKQCEDAVRVACMVGHIPEPDCFASFDESNHGRVVEHIMKLIDSGANCAQKLETTASNTCTKPPCYNTNKHSLKKAKKEPHYLCVCLEDRQSEICKQMVQKACKAGAIPKDSCDVALKADFHHAVTRHIMHLIDHGSECGVGGVGYLTFTNNRCHCKQEWTAPNGEVLKFPDNCRDPGNQKGFSWCETFPDEGCIGVGDSMSWDRCDHPQRPRYHLGQFAQTSIGKITPVDHYLCVCVDKAANDDACEAAVKAACMVGHLDSDSCARSFQSEDHSKLSDEILKMISHGARCTNVEIGFSKDVSSLREVPYTTIASGCGHGVLQNDGTCACAPGYAGQRCDFCADGFVGYPDCIVKRDCEPACMYGTCDFHNGQCLCPSNRQGSVCSECAFGYNGAECSPGLLAHHGAGLWFVLMIIGGSAYLCCCTPFGAQVLSNLPGVTKGHGGAYSRLNQDADFFDDDGSDKVLDVDVSADDVAETSMAPVPSARAFQPTHSHTGLAI